MAEAPEDIQSQVLTRIEVRDLVLPVYRIDIGSLAEDAPVVLLVGGVHGLERIGTQVVIAWLASLLARLRWDDHLRELLGRVRIVALPILNPGGMFLNQRANPAGVDLMRNAPIIAQGESTFLLGGSGFRQGFPGTPASLNRVWSRKVKP